MNPIIIDTDPGIDDALAILLACNLGLDIRAVTTVFGNSTIENCTNNAKYILNNLSGTSPLYIGSSKPVTGEAMLASSHGESGLGNIDTTNAQYSHTQEMPAADYLATGLDFTHSLLCLGPLTNLANALAKNPETLKHTDKLIIMGGAFSARGNITKFAEFNAYNDPEALKIVLDSAQKYGVETVIIPIEVCQKVTLSYAELQTLEASMTALPAIHDIVKPYIDYYVTDAEHGGFNGAVMYDLLVPLYLAKPDLFETKTARVDVALTSEERGQTSANDDDTSSIRVCFDVDGERAKKLIMEYLEV